MKLWQKHKRLKKKLPNHKNYLNLSKEKPLI